MIADWLLLYVQCDAEEPVPIQFWRSRFRKVSRLTLALIPALVLSLCFAGLASAHGGGGEELHRPAPAWMIGLIYVQLFMIPVVGVWLVREAISAWLRPAGRQDSQGVQHDTFR